MDLEQATVILCDWHGFVNDRWRSLNTAKNPTLLCMKIIDCAEKCRYKRYPNCFWCNCSLWCGKIRFVQLNLSINRFSNFHSCQRVSLTLWVSPTSHGACSVLLRYLPSSKSIDQNNIVSVIDGDCLRTGPTPTSADRPRSRYTAYRCYCWALRLLHDVERGQVAESRSTGGRVQHLGIRIFEMLSEYWLLRSRSALSLSRDCDWMCCAVSTKAMLPVWRVAARVAVMSDSLCEGLRGRNFKRRMCFLKMCGYVPVWLCVCVTTNKSPTTILFFKLNNNTIVTFESFLKYSCGTEKSCTCLRVATGASQTLHMPVR